MAVKIITGVFKNIVDNTKGKMIRRLESIKKVDITPEEDDEEMSYVYIECGEPIQTGDILSVFDNKVYKADKNIEFRKKYIGVSTENGITGESIKVITSGKFTMSTNMTNGWVYMGNMGTILISPPTDGIAYKIGVIVNGTTLILNDYSYIKL